MVAAPASSPVSPAEAPPSRRTGILLTVGLVALIVVLMATFLAFTTDDGADTAEGAAHAMMGAIQDGDLVGVVQQLPPGERRAVVDGTQDLVAPLQRLGLLGPVDTGHLDGVSFRFDGITTTTTQLDKDVQAIDLTGGTFTAQLAPGGAPMLTDKARTILDRNGVTVDPQTSSYHRDFATDPLRVVAIREGGGWHISLAYSVAEALRSQAGAPAPKMGTGPPAIGAATPAEAVSEFATAYADGNPGRVLDLIYPDEARVLYDYAPIFLPQATAAAKAAAERGTYDVQLNQLTTSVSGDGPVRKVQVTGADLDIRDEVKKVHVTYDGKCLHTDQRLSDADAPYRKSDTCDGDWGADDVATRDRDNPLANLAVFGGGADLPTFTVVERNGRWFISPVRTLLDSLVKTLDQVPADKVDVLADRLAASWRAGAGGGISGTPLTGEVTRPDATDAERRVARAAALVDACGRLLAPPVSAPTTTTASPPTTAPADPATEQLTQSCVRNLVTSGRVDPTDLTPAQRLAAGVGT